jgi:probable HAF family extracellular repeat protein
MASAQTYQLTDLGSLGGGSSYGWGINSSGQVTGYSVIVGGSATHAFISNGTTMTDLGTLGGTNSYAWGINSSGQVTGNSDIAGGGATHAFISNGTTMTDLGTLGGTNSSGHSINASGQVAGTSDVVCCGRVGAVTQHALIANGTTLTDLDPFGLYTSRSNGSGINDSGQVTGDYTNSGRTAGYISNGTMIIDLGDATSGSAINASGQVTGSALFAGDRHAFIGNGTTSTDLGTLGGTYSVGLSINASGKVTGFSGDLQANGEYLYRGFLYNGTAMVDLNTLVTASPLAAYVTITEGHAINDNGWIVADGIDSRTDETHAYLLTPVSTDGSTLTVPQAQAGGSLITSAGKWTFGMASNAYGNTVLLNGGTNGGYATLLEVASGGQLYAKASDNSWWRWKNPGWTSSSAPPATTTVSPDGSTLTVPQSQAGGTLTTTSGTWNFGAASNAYGSSVLLNGGTNGGYATLLEVASGGQLYAKASDNSWWRWNNPRWSSSSAPQTTTVSPDGSTLTVPQSQAGGTLVTTTGMWNFGAASNAYGFSVLLNGGTNGGYAALLEVAHGGQLYAQASDSSWWQWNNPGWSSSPGPF